MQKRILFAIMLANLVALPALAQDQVGLPPVRNSLYMGQPGDGIRSDLGHKISGRSVHALSKRGIGLPPVRNSLYMGQPGDSIRTDMGNRISGQRFQPGPGIQQVGLPDCRNSLYMGQPGDGIRSDMGRHISGNVIQRQAPPRFTQASQRPVYANAFVYKDYH